MRYPSLFKTRIYTQTPVEQPSRTLPPQLKFFDLFCPPSYKPTKIGCARLLTKTAGQQVLHRAVQSIRPHSELNHRALADQQRIEQQQVNDDGTLRCLGELGGAVPLGRARRSNSHVGRMLRSYRHRSIRYHPKPQVNHHRYINKTTRTG